MWLKKYFIIFLIFFSPFNISVFPIEEVKAQENPQSNFEPYDEYSEIDRKARVIKTYFVPENFYNESSGKWQKINTSLKILTPSDFAYQYGYRYGQTDTKLDVYAKEWINDSYPLAVNVSGFAVQYEPVAVGYVDWVTKENKTLQYIQPSKAIVKDNKITWVNAFYDTNITRRLDSWRWKEEIVMGTLTKTWMQNNPPSSFGLSNANSYLVFYFRMKFTNLNIHKNGGVEKTSIFEVDSGRLEFRDSIGNLKWFLPLDNVYTQGQENNISAPKIPIKFRVVGTGNQRDLFFGVKVTDLNALAFPVVFDPTDESTTITGDASLYSDAPNNNNDGEVNLIPQNVSGADNRILINVTLPTIDGSINAVDLVLTCYGGAGVACNTSALQGHNIYRVLEASITSQATWYARLTGANWTNFGAEHPTSSNATAIDTNVRIGPSVADRSYFGLMGENATNPMALVSGGNYAFIIKTNYTAQAVDAPYLASKEHVTSSYRPYLTVQYTGYPSFSIQSPTNTTYTTNSVWSNLTSIVWGDGAGNVTVQLDSSTNYSATISGTNASYQLTSLADGAHNVKFFVNNSAGLMNSTEVVYFTVDTVPVITINSPTNTTYSTQSVALNVTSNANVNLWRRSLDGGTNATDWDASSNTSANKTITLSATGNHNFRVCGNRTSNGLEGCSTVYFTADWVAPTSFSPVANLTMFSGNPVEPNFTISDDFYTGTDTLQYNYSWNDVETVNSLATSGTKEALSKTADYGNNTWNVTIRDGAANSFVGGVYRYILDNKTLIYGLDNRVFATSGNITREPTTGGNASVTFTSISVNSKNVTFNSDSGSLFKLKDFDSRVDITISGKGTLTLTPAGTVIYYNETSWSSDRWDFQVSGDTGTLTITRTGFPANARYNRYVNSTVDKEVTVDSSGSMSDTISLSTRSVSYLRIIATTPSDGGVVSGGVVSGGGAIPAPVKTRYCEKLNVNILESEWTEAKCVIKEVEPIWKEARIIYFGQDILAYPYSLETCKVILGANDGCRKNIIQTQKTTRILGRAWSTTGILKVKDYNWEIYDLTRNKLYAAVNTTEFQIGFDSPANFTIKLRVWEEDTNIIYEAEHFFEVTGEPILEKPALDVDELKGKIPKIEVVTLYDKLHGFYNQFTSKLSVDLSSIKLPTLGLSMSGVVDEARENPYMPLFIILLAGGGYFVLKEIF